MGHIRLGCATDGLLDFSQNLNPFPPSFSWNPDKSLVSFYPDDRYPRLKEEIARIEGCSPDMICLGNGSVEIMRTFCHTVISPGDKVAVFPPTFSEYDLSVRIAGGISVPASDGAVAEFICNPNNPTGALLEREAVLDRIASAEEVGRILFVDEAFIDLADPSRSVIDMRSPSLFVLRSLTKAYAVPGIRFGYGVGDPDLVAAMEAVRPPWTVNAFAEAYALEALANRDQLISSREAIRVEREWMQERFERLGISFEPSSVNFILISTGRIPAADVKERLLGEGILVRDCTSFGLPFAVRVAVRTRGENERLVEVLARCMH
ncbi:pyridoxal phosphate-dependent aminotransferase [Methanovulcanius yangii]|uniref:pyridoxal phosphate-dependent aminotransferase n=1 Tax=Methanovulcanius yangii TaxID=1789227 RepID=UPI0029C9D1DE|nr:histidinol-phosphate transaminase [Methanovulcanius yangii]